MIDPYEILEVSTSASQDEIKKAFREKALKYHPDKGGDEEKFKQVNEAYSILSDANKRSHYDAMKDGMPGGFGGFGFGARQGGGFGNSPFSDLFGDLFGTKKKKQARPTSDRDILFNLQVSLEQIKQGISETVIYEKNVVCQGCEGKGGKNKRKCSVCEGSGVLIQQPNHYTIYQKTCHACQGSGTGFGSVCRACRGRGQQKKKKSVSFIIKEI